MCGIFAAVGPSALEIGSVYGETVARQMSHRGPDDEGFHFGHSSFLVHTRLAIFSPADAGQPLLSSDGRYALVFNGEIFNSAELRRLSCLRDWNFRTNSDTETLLAMLTQQNAMALLRMVRGFYAFVLIDLVQNSVLAVRDPLGIKPLHYSVVNETLLIASEVGALRVVQGVGDEPNEACFSEFLVFGANAGRETVYSRINRLQPGEVLRWRNCLFTIEDFRSSLIPSTQSLDSLSFDEVVGGLRQTLEEAVTLWTGGDVAVDALVSGGVDSMAVSSIAGKRVRRNFTLAFVDAPQLDEGKQIEGRLTEAPFLVPVSNTDYVNFFNQSVKIFDEPMGDSNYLSSWALSLAVSRGGGKAALVGDGADELFGGYKRHSEVAQKFEDDKKIETIVWANNYIARPRLTTAGVLLSANIESRVAFVSRLLQRPNVDTINSVLEYDERFFLEMYLQQKDRAGMRHGVEFRPVFLDQRVVAYARSIPGRFKVHRQYGKYVLRKAMADLIGHEIAFKPNKLALSAPIETFWHEGGFFDKRFRALFGDSPRLDFYLSPSGVTELLSQHQKGKENHSNTLWRILALEEWMRTAFA